MNEEERNGSEFINDDKDNEVKENGYGNNRCADDTRACQEKVKEDLQENEKDNEAQAQSSRQEGNNDNETETEARSQESYHQTKTSYEETVREDRSKGSYSYVPPRGSSEHFGGERSEKKKKRSGFAVVMISAVLVVAILVTAILPTFLMNIGLLAVNGFVGLGNILDGIFSIQIEDGNGDGQGKPSTPNAGGENMNVIKNDEGITGEYSVAKVVELVADTVVEIETKGYAYDVFGRQVEVTGAGSGVIITADGYIITNHHVIEGSYEVLVSLTDGSSPFEATIVGSSPETDIAVLKINATGLDFATMGSSKALVVGQEVVAIGNPLGSLGGTVTDGIISALDRRVKVDEYTMTLMQTNAAINRGNSGGGLFNRAGELIGIVNAKQADTGIEGLGFAIPIDIACESVKTIADKAGCKINMTEPSLGET